MDQRPGSKALGSFMAPIGPFQSGVHSSVTGINHITDLTIGRKVLMGAMSPNGLFGVAVEQGRMWLITLKGVSRGLICLKTSLDWPSKLQEAVTGISAMSVSIVDSYGTLKIVAVDGWSNIISKVIKVPNMPGPLDDTLMLQILELPQQLAELPPDAMLSELPEERNSRREPVSTGS
jgi:hypothetical protein